MRPILAHSLRFAIPGDIETRTGGTIYDNDRLKEQDEKLYYERLAILMHRMWIDGKDFRWEAVPKKELEGLALS